MRIGLTGKMASGKSLVAQYLVDRYAFEELAFAARLKVIATELFGNDIALKNARGRFILQQLADRMRGIDQAVWIRVILSAIPAMGNVVVSDVRFPNEYETLKRLGFTMVRMNMDRPTQERVVQEHYPDLPLILMDDFSETALDGYAVDFNLLNNGGIPLNHVYRQVDTMVTHLQEVADGNRK